MNYICPICHKSGLPNYKLHSTTCPQCNSNLRTYLLLHKLYKRRIIINAIFLVSLLILILFSTYYFTGFSKYKSSYSKQKSELLSYHDTLLELRGEINQLKLDLTSKKEITILYEVKKGDYPAKIAEYFYNDWEKYKKIEEDNNLIQPYVLKVGQTLIIKLSN